MREWLSMTHHLMTNHNFELKIGKIGFNAQILCVDEKTKKGIDQ